MVKTLQSWLVDTAKILVNSSVPGLEVRVLAAHGLAKRNEEILAHPEYLLTESDEQRLNALALRRRAGEPLAYIIGKKEFLGLELTVSPATLIPRPETEAITQCAIQVASQLSPAVIYEVGTGSGAIAIGLAMALPGQHIVASDISREALAIAAENIGRLGLSRIELMEASLASHIQHAPLLVANLPYLPEDLAVSPEVGYEPAIALWSGRDGLDHYRQLLATAAFDWAVIELGSDQYAKLADWAMTALPDKSCAPVYGIDRQVVGMVISPSGSGDE